MKHFLGLALVMALAFGVGCGDDSGGGGAAGAAGNGAADAGGAGASEAVSKMITAADGGKVTAGEATLDIPADALAKDTKITVEEVDKTGLPDADTIASDVYDFGPDGTMFDKPVTLTIGFDATATPDGMTAIMAYLDGKTWEPLADSAISGDSVKATTDHFTMFAVVWTAAGVMQSAGTCDDAFTACGGDIVGTWTVSIGCLTLPADFAKGSTGQATCNGAMATASLDISGTVTFEASGNYAADLVFAQDVTITIPKSCLSMGASCADLGKQGDPVPVDTGDACEQTMQGSMPNMTMGTYTVDDAAMTFTTTATDGSPGKPNEYCVKDAGDKFTLEARSPGDTKSPEVRYVAERPK